MSSISAPQNTPEPIPADIRAKVPAPQTADWWPQRFEEKRKEIAATGGSSVVFIGDSITHGWEWPDAGKTQWGKYFAGAPYHALQLGYSGDRTEHVLWRIEHGELDGYEAKAVVLMIGTNNTGHFPFGKEPPADTIIGVKAVVDAILQKQPKARVILLPILPRGGGTDDECRRRDSIVNREIMKLADGIRVVWCDFSTSFLLPDGTIPHDICPDGLHPCAAGYEIWANAVMPTIDRVLATPPGIPVPSVFAALQDPSGRTSERRPSLIPETRISFDKGAGNWWIERLAANRRQIAQSGGEIDLVFMGDSITHYWDIGEGLDTSTEILELRKKFTVLNCGYGGDQAQHLLWRAENGELDGYRAKLVMLLIGTNNSGAGRPPEETFAAIEKVVETIHAKQPQAKVLLLKLFPRGTAKSPAHIRNQSVNALIAARQWEDYVIVKDLTDIFADAEGNARPELFDYEVLHMSDEGFIRWRRAVEPIFDAVCGK